MRKILSPLALLLGVALVVLGIGQQTWWAPPPLIQATSAKVHDAAPLTVITPEVEGISEDGVELTIKADGKFKVAMGRTVDVEAWVGDAAHQKVTGLTEAEDKTPVIELDKIDGKKSVPDPSDSDLWVDVHEATDSMLYRFENADQQDKDWSLLLFTDGKDAAPTEFVTDYHVEPDHSGPVAVIMVGIVFLLLGLFLLRGPQRPKGRRRRIEGAATVAVAGALALSLTQGAQPAQAQPSPSESATPSESASPKETDAGAAPKVQLVAAQAERIINDTADKVAAADKAQKISTAAKKRLGGAAEKLRASNYAARKKAKDLAKLAPIGTNLRTFAGTTDPGFPRQLLIVSDQGKSDIPQLLFFEQKSARSNYRLVSATPMVPGSSLDPIDPTQIGTVSAKQTGLVATPEKLFTDLAKNLSDNKQAKYLTTDLKDNTYIQLIRKDQDDQKKNNPDAKVSFARSFDKSSLTGIQLKDGSVLATGTLRYTTKTVPEDGATLKLDKLPKELTGSTAESVEQTLTVQKEEQFTVLIPAKDAAEKKIQVLGVTEVTKNASLN